MGMINYISKNAFLLSELVKKGIKLKYRRSYLGILWSLIEPIISTIVLVIVFGTLFKTDTKTYPLFIIIGRLFFSFFQVGTTNAMVAIRSNGEMIKKVYVPKYLYPLAHVIFSFIIFLISLIVLVGVDVFCQVVPTWHIIQFIPAILLLFLLTLGCGTILSVLNVFFRDIEYIWNVLCMILMYMSAVFYYPDSILQSQFGWILKINPIYHITTMARDAFFGNPMDIVGFLYSCGFIAVVLIVGSIFFYKQKNKFVLYL
ncbi:MAG: ABC transporter permease [Treponema sp.]|nr:ABC transporter permease [Treponema sp.]